MPFNNSRIWGWLIVAAAFYFVARGPWRALYDSGDFLNVYSATRCWVHGGDPYATADLVRIGRAAGAPVSEAYFAGLPSVYLPPSLLLLAPFALFPWAVAKTVWLCFLTGSCLWLAASTVTAVKRWALPLWCYLLAFAPLHTGLRKGQPTVLVCSLIAASLLVSEPLLAGLLLGVAACIKPQLAFGFLLLALLAREFRKLLAACLTGLVITLAALARLRGGSLAHLFSNLSLVGGGINSASPDNPIRFQLINIDTLLPSALYGVATIAIVYAIIALLSAIAVVRSGDIRIAISVVASATVLLGYHRFYDAEILWLAIPALLLMPVRSARILCLAYSVFLIPGQTMAAAWLKSRADDPWFLPLMRHETLACILIWLTFLASALRRQAPCKPPSEPG
jgi:hypothetical protein